MSRDGEKDPKEAAVGGFRRVHETRRSSQASRFSVSNEDDPLPLSLSLDSSSADLQRTRRLVAPRGQPLLPGFGSPSAAGLRTCLVSHRRAPICMRAGGVEGAIGPGAARATSRARSSAVTLRLRVERAL